MLVDDAHDLRQMVRSSLERSESFQVVAEAADGAAGVGAARQHQPDVVLLDIAMPVMDGLQALTLIREDCPDAVVVVLSSFGAGSGLPRQALDLGAHGYLRKGQVGASLAAELRDIVDAARTR